MTSTSVKNLGSTLMNLAVSQAGKSAVGTAGFQQVWSNQMNRSTADNTARDNAAKPVNRQMQRGSSLKARESQPVQKDEPNGAEELSSEEQGKAMEVLNAAALELMQEIADTFGMSMEELQSVMEGMDLEAADLLNASELSNLLLNLSGAEDASALVTDGELYDTYRMLMEQRDALLQESADVLETEPEQLILLLEKGFDEAAPAKELPAAEELQTVGEDIGNEKEAGDTDRKLTETADVRSTAEQEQRAEDTDGKMTEVTDIQNVTEEEQETQNQNGAQTKEEGRRSDGQSDKGNQVNLYTQDFRMQFQPNVQQTESAVPAGPWSENTQEIMDQIMDYMKLQVNADTTNLEMQLHPASLGTIQIQIASKAGAVTANFIAQNETVKAALETQMVQLKEQFEEQGIKVEAIEVTVQTHEFERNLDEQGRGRNQQEPERKGRVRRINLNASFSGEELEEEDALAADMMVVDGSTVDYTA